MTFEEFYDLNVGDIVTPMGQSKDKGRLFKVVALKERYRRIYRRLDGSICNNLPGRDNGIWVIPIDEKPITVTCPMIEGPYYGDEACRHYQYQALKIVEQA